MKSLGEIMIDIERFMTYVRISMLRTHCFYGHILTQLPTIYSTTEVPTLGVGKNSPDEIVVKLFVNPEYVESIINFTNGNEEKSVNHFVEVLKHEVHHLIFGHLSFDLPDKQRQTIAAECSVNSYVNRYNLISTNGEKPGVFAEDFGFESKLSLKEYYDLLNNNEKYQQMMFNSVCAKEGENNNSIDSHEKWKAISSDSISEEMIKDIVRQAAETCKQSNKWGNMPGELMNAIQDNFMQKKNIIPWQVVLKNFLASSSENILDYSMKRISKRFGTRPGTIKNDVLSVAIGIDTSGSISDGMLSIFFSELDAIAKTNTKMEIFEWDTEVQRRYDFREFDGCVKGRGGTNPVPALEEMTSEKFDCIIMFTDFEFFDIDYECGVPILWVVNNYYGSSWEGKHLPVKEGIILEFNEKEETFKLVNTD